MASMSGPTRPPRTSRNPRESSASGLISVIRNLSTSEDNEDRDRERSRLEKEFKRSDQRLDALIETQREPLIRAMQDFNKISTRITSSRDRVKQAKQKLLTAKILLQCKRDELRRLWLESVEHSHVLHLLEQIESLNSIPQKLEKYIKVGRNLRATKDLMKSVAILDGELNGVDALRDVKDNLQLQKENLHKTMMNELHKHIYEDVNADYLSKFEKNGRTSKFEKTVPRIAPSIDDQELLKMEDAIEKLDPEKQVVILIRCLILLDKIPESVELIRERCQDHLFNIVTRTSAAVARTGDGPESLLKFMDLVFAQFGTIAERHKLILSHLEPHVITDRDAEGNPVFILYSMEDITSKMQHVLTTLLNCYLGSTNLRQDTHNAFGAGGSESLDVNMFFVKKRFTNVNPTKQRKLTLFKFENSQLAITKSTFLQEQLMNSKDRAEGVNTTVLDHVVCQPSYKNITHMFKPMLRFIEDLGCSEKSPLHNVLTESVEGFLSMVADEIQVVLEQSAKLLELDEFRVVTDAESLKTLKVNRPLLQSCVCVNGELQVLREHAQALPQFASEFVDRANYIVQQFKDVIENAYRAIVPPQEIRQTNSNHWISDQDICRCLMGLPNWINLTEAEHEEVEESPEDIRLRNQQEVSILLSNLGQKKIIPISEIFNNVQDLKYIAYLHESLEWLSLKIGEICDVLKVDKDHPAEDNNLGETLRKLKESAVDIQDIANKCLLLLHLEVRVHCFYYLLPLLADGHFTTSGSTLDGQDVDRQVLEFVDDLTKIEEALNVSLQPRKRKYVFEGLGQVVAVILMNAVPQIHRVTDAGVRRICRDIHAMQQKLTAIAAGREVSLDHARQYFELMLLQGQEVLNGIVENGPQFQMLNYKNLLELLCRSRPDEKDKMDWYNNRLKDILSGVPVKI